MCWPEKCTASRGRSEVPVTRRRIRVCRILMRSIVCIELLKASCHCPPASLLLDRLAFLAEDLFTSVPNPFSFVRFRRVIRPNIGGHLTHYLFVYSFD